MTASADGMPHITAIAVAVPVGYSLVRSSKLLDTQIKLCRQTMQGTCINQQCGRAHPLHSQRAR